MRYYIFSQNKVDSSTSQSIYIDPNHVVSFELTVQEGAKSLLITLTNQQKYVFHDDNEINRFISEMIMRRKS